MWNQGCNLLWLAWCQIPAQTENELKYITVEPTYNDTDLYETSYITSDTNEFLNVNHNITLLGYNDTPL